MIWFVGAGPGAEDLITVRGQRLLMEADLVIYAGSLVNPELLKCCKESCEIRNSAFMTLEQVIDAMKEQMRTNHIMRLKNGDCGVETGFVLSDLLTNLERVSDHCSIIAGCVIDLRQHNLNLHASLQASRNGSEEYLQTYRTYARKYSLQG